MKNRALVRVWSGLGGMALAFLAGTASGQAAFEQDPPDALSALTRNPDGFVRYDGQKVVRVVAKNQRDVLAVTSLCDNVWSHGTGVGSFDVQIDGRRLANLDELGIAYTVLIDDLQRRVEDERADIIARAMQRDLAWFANYKTRTEINAYMDSLAAGSGGLAVSETLPGAATIGGRTLKAIRITGPDAPGNPKATRPALIFNSCQHAREWISPMTTMYFADQLLAKYSTDARIKGIVDNCEIIIVPIVNPDGYEYTWSTQRLWRKNRKPNGDGSFGVDNNRNWAFGWGGEGASTVPSNDTYRGPSAASEVETQVLANYITSIPRIKAHIDFHSYSQLIMSPWAYTSTLPVDNALFLQLDQAMATAVFNTYGKTYTYGPVYTTIYPASGGASDWTYGARNILGFSFELRDTGTNGFTLPADQIIPTGEENFNAIKVLAEYVAYPFTFAWTAGAAPSFLVADSANTVQIDITNASGTVNPSSALLWYRVGASDPFASTPLTLLSGTTYQATIPAVGCGQNVQMYAEATSTGGRTLQFPAGGAAAPAQATSLTTFVLFNDTCETNSGWSLSVGDDNATTGRWELAVPQATTYQPGSDHTPSAGTKCYVTGAAAGTGDGSFDIDGGKTTLTSPTFSAVAPSVEYTTLEVASANLSYWRTYGVNGVDTMPVQLSNDAGSTWTQIEGVTANEVSWTNRTFNVPSIMTPTANMKLRFIAKDDNPASVVEAAVDDVTMIVTGCRWSYADRNRDGTVDLVDFFEFLNCFDQSLPCGDVNGDLSTDLGDFFDFLNAFDQAG
jgi:murein tripeptide amidase MpaA